MKNLLHIIRAAAAPAGCICAGIAALCCLHQAVEGTSKGASLMFDVCLLVAYICFLGSCRQGSGPRQ